jgi:hypothetical protein
MLDYLASIMDVNGNVPMIGDADDGRVLRLAPEEGFSPYRSLLATGAIVFRSGEFQRKAGVLDDKTRWLAGAAGRRAVRRPERRHGQLAAAPGFPGGGLLHPGLRFRAGERNSPGGDAGPLGFRGIAAHGHADALSFTLSVNGLEFLIDPGTYAYHMQAPWRQYFRGTAAHNTVRVDASDQSEPGGNFMWLRKAHAGCSQWRSTPEEDRFEGWQDGYLRLADPVMHRRRIVLQKRSRLVTIEDSLQMTGAHDVELLFHCSERCRIEAAPGGYVLHQGGNALRLALPAIEGASSMLYLGSVAPIFGWVSRRFDEKQPSPTLVWRCRLEGNVVLRSQIAC